jgi:hypothetical protein
MNIKYWLLKVIIFLRIIGQILNILKTLETGGLFGLG